jgi:N-acyl-L-homoserine lactone synthetase
MIIIVEPKHRDLYAPQIQQMYRMRYEVVVESWGWNVPTAQSGYEFDQFDLENSVYILHQETAGAPITGCCRLNPSLGPNMMSDLFPDACDLQEMPRNSSVWEATRFVTSEKLVRSQRYKAMWELSIGVNEYCLANQVDQVVWYTNTGLYQSFSRAFAVEPLGRPAYHEKDNETYIPLIANMDRESLKGMRARLKNSEEAICFALAPVLSPLSASQPHSKEAA